MRQTIISLYAFKKNKAEQGDRDAKRELPLRVSFHCATHFHWAHLILSNNFDRIFILPVEMSLQVSFSVFYNQVHVFYKDMEHFVPIINTNKIPS